MKLIHLFYGLLIASTTTFTIANACTRILRADNEPAVMVGRNMDWNMPDRMAANLWVYPRGMERNGFVPDNPLRWRSKYGSIAATSFDNVMPVTSDGMNEHGFAAHLNSLVKSNYGERNKNIPGLSVVMWAQYFLDNFKTVDEAVKFAASNAFQMVPFQNPASGKYINVHLAIEDETGDSAIIEYVDGTMHVYRDRSYTAMTNDPEYSEQLANLKQYQGFGGNRPLPGTASPEDRFVRATFYAAHLPEYKNVRDELSGMFGVIQNVTHPASATSKETPYTSETVWRVVSDLTNRTYYFSNMKGLNLLVTSLNQFNLREGEAPMRLIVQERTDLAGDVTKLFEKIVNKP